MPRRIPELNASYTVHPPHGAWCRLIVRAGGTHHPRVTAEDAEAAAWRVAYIDRTVARANAGWLDGDALAWARQVIMDAPAFGFDIADGPTAEMLDGFAVPLGVAPIVE